MKSASGRARTPVDKPLEAILRRIKSLDPLPEVALRVMELSRRSDVVPRELAELIRTDAALTAKLLRLCNSAYYGFRREIGALDEAAVRLGNQTLTNLVLTTCASGWFHDLGRSTRASRELLWRRSVTNALAASLLARMAGEIDPHRAYTVGLLQNVGHVVLDRWLASEADAIATLVSTGRSQVAAERELLGLDHAEAGAVLAERWCLPEALCDAIRHHHEPARAHEGAELAAVAGLGEEITYALEDEAEEGALVLVELELETLAGVPAREVVASLRRELEQARELVALA